MHGSQEDAEIAFGLTLESLELILGSASICLICICCAGIITIFIIKRSQKKQEMGMNVNILIDDDRRFEDKIEDDGNKDENLLQIDSRDNDKDNDKDEYVEITSIKQRKKKKEKKKKQKKMIRGNGDDNKNISLIGMISDERRDELYELYCKSRIKCMQKCHELGFKDKFIDQLFNEFEEKKVYIAL